MPNRALVIGIDRYWTGAACLKGAVRDALSMVEWLTAAGGVAPAGITLLLSRVDGVSPSTELPWQEATHDNILLAVRDLAAQPFAGGDRLYFYFAGHGLTAPSDLEQPALVPSDFTDFFTTKAIGLDSLFQVFQACSCTQQFFFLDACRNIPYAGRFRVSQFPWAPDPSQLRADVEQFVFRATSRGLTAAEAVDLAGQEHGAFTAALLEGLQGKGSAKSYRVAADRYVVTVESLLGYVVRRVRETVRSLPAAARSPLQTPVLTGERYSNPVLAEFPGDAVNPVHLDILVEPPEARLHATVRVLRDGPAAVAELPPPLEAPARVRIPPRDYRLRADAAGFEPEPPFVPVDLYDDSSQTVILKPREHSSLPETAPLPPAPSPGRRETLSKAFLEFVADQIRKLAPILGAPVVGPLEQGRPSRLPTEPRLQPPAPGRIAVSCPDDMAVVELLDADRNVVARGRGQIQADNLAPGFYRGRMVASRGEAVEQLVFVQEGENPPVHVNAPELAPQSTMAALVEEYFDRLDDNSVDLTSSLGVGPIAAPSLATVMTLSASAQNLDPDAMPALRLRSLGGRLREAIPVDAPSALYAMFGDERSGNASEDSYFESLRVACQSLDGAPSEPERPRLLQEDLPIADIAWARPTGMVWLSVRMPGLGALLFPSALLPGRLMTWIFHRNASGHTSVFAFQPPLFPKGRDTTIPRLQRRLEVAERLCQSGRYEEALPLVIPQTPGPEALDELLLCRWEAPVSALLGSYILFRLARAGRLPAGYGSPQLLRDGANRLVESFGELIDPWVVRGQLSLLNGDKGAAARDFASALDRGVPLFADGLQMLAAGVAECGLQHPRLSLMRQVRQHRVPGLLWAAWRQP